VHVELLAHNVHQKKKYDVRRGGITKRNQNKSKGRNNVSRHSKLKIATPQELARITPWVQLGHKKYLVEAKKSWTH